jgi:putative AdoMet-dependent methyltransferase
MGEAKRWDFDTYDWVDEYDARIRNKARLCYDAAIGSLARLSQARPGETVIDIGTGTGNSAVPFLEVGCSVLGLDPSRRMLAQAQEKAGRWPGKYTVSLVDDPFLSLPVASEAADIVVAAYAIHHLDDEAKQAAICEMSRVLAPGGRIVIADTMFQDAAHRQQVIQRFPEVEEEYHPLLSSFPRMFGRQGLPVTLYQIGELVWTLVASRP